MDSLNLGGENVLEVVELPLHCLGGLHLVYLLTLVLGLSVDCLASICDEGVEPRVILILARCVNVLLDE